MSKITNYSFLFQNMFGRTTNSLSAPQNRISVSSLSSAATRQQLKAAGIDVDSKQYKAAIKQMLSGPGAAAGYTNIQSIKNLMSSYDKNGDWIDPTTGLTGLLITDENRNSWKKIISVPESSRDEMFESTKREFLRENGVLNGDTTNRTEVYKNMYRKVQKDDRLAAGWTLGQYERAYRQAFLDAVKAADPSWEIGKPIKSGVLDNITREAVEAALTQAGNKLVKKSVDIKI